MIQRMLSHSMRDDRWCKRDGDDRGQQPRRTNDEGPRKRKLNSSDSDECQKRLPSRLRLVEVTLFGHSLLIMQSIHSHLLSPAAITKRVPAHTAEIFRVAVPFPDKPYEMSE